MKSYLKSYMQAHDAPAARPAPEPQGWTREPWGVERTELNFWVGPLRSDGSGKVAAIVFGTSIEGLSAQALEHAVWNASRIVVSVNALAGLNLEALASMLAAADALLFSNSVDNHLKLRAALAALRNGGGL